MVDWALYAEFAEDYSLDTGKDNKSVWDPRWLWRGLAKFGDTFPTTLATKFRRFSSSMGDESIRAESGETESAGGSEASGSTTIGAAGVGVLGHPKFDYSVVAPGRAVLTDSLVGGGSGNRGAGFDPRVYECAKAAALSVSGGRSRRYPPLHENEVVDKVLHLDKSAGLPFLTNAGDSLDLGIARARDIRAGKRGFDPHVAFRRIQHDSDGPKGRLVWGSPLATTILAAAFAKAAYKGLVRRHCFSYGYQKAEVGTFISEFRARWKRQYCLDFSGFDSSVPPFVIGDAFEILRSHLDLNSEETELFYRLTNDFIHTRLVLPDCSMWQVHRGIPSGSPFTSVIGSICNLIILNYIWIRLTGVALREDQVLILGDDSVVATNCNLPLSDIASAALELGMVISESKSLVAGTGRDVEFLGHVWINGRPHRPERDMVIRFVFEERHRPQDITMTYMRLYGFTSDCMEAYDLIVKLILRPNQDVNDALEEMARIARGSPMKLDRIGSSRLRYLIAHEPELLPRSSTASAKLSAIGMKY
jgi:hypothetical protein